MATRRSSSKRTKAARAPAAKKLARYGAKRDFATTPEPAPGPGAAAPGQPAGKPPIFVVHKHDASRLHYDFRLEIGGVMASWAVPKGPSLNPADKRLAVRVEDHPLDYAGFEGVIPAEEYGGGTVMVWDCGQVRYKEDESASKMLQAGVLEFELAGTKLAGGWRLIHTKMGGQEKNWLLVKRHDGFARAAGDVLVEQPNSARTGRSLEQIAADPASPRPPRAARE